MENVNALPLFTTINVTGNALANRMTGNSVGNTFSGLGGNDTLAGEGGTDFLFGGSGNDILRGQEGADILTGGTGRDRFDLDAASHSGVDGARDQITDFNRNQDDRVDLSTIDAKTGVAGNQAFQFIGTKRFSGNSSGKLRFDTANDLLLGSTDSDTAAEFSIHLPNRLVWTRDHRGVVK